MLAQLLTCKKTTTMFLTTKQQFSNKKEFIPVEIYLTNKCVAEGISYFCLARNLIRPLGSTHNFTQSG